MMYLMIVCALRISNLCYVVVPPLEGRSFIICIPMFI